MKRYYRFLIFLILFLFLHCGQVSAAPKTYTFYGNTLTGFDKIAYARIVEQAPKSLDSVDIVITEATTYSLNLGIFMLNDYPRLFWNGGYWTSSDSHMVETDGGEFAYETVISYTPMESWEGAFKKQSVFNKSVKKAVAAVKKRAKGKSQAQKARIALEYIAANCSYKSSKFDQSAYGVFVKKKAVCAGYARAYKLLLDELGIKCICVEGITRGSSHLFNYVRIGKKWYYVDPTWCDVGSTASDRYFLLGKKTSQCFVDQSFGVKLPALSKTDYYKK